MNRVPRKHLKTRADQAYQNQSKESGQNCE
jgi:hypothetical protein